MNKYLLKFYKHGNMRFISHLDLGRLFRRAIKRAEIDVDFSNGFNPHEKINIVQPLSLGFESDSEYFEITTRKFYETEELKDLLNQSMPTDICFTDCKEIDFALGNLSNLCYAARYTASLEISDADYGKIDLESFLSQNQVFIKKRDKKTKAMVDKDVKSLILGLKEASYIDNRLTLELLVRCATNESLNPSNLVIALFDYFDIDYEPDKTLITRRDLLMTGDGDSLKSLYDC